MREEHNHDRAESDAVLTGGCAYLGGIAADLRMLVMAQCPGCQGNGPCIVREAIRTVAAESPVEAHAACTRPLGAIQ